MEMERVSLMNICRGAVEEVFQHELEKVLENLRDSNTDDKAKRKLSLTFDFEPYPDRTGAVVNFSVKTSLVGLKPVGGTIHLMSTKGKLEAYPHDPRQDVMFEPIAGQKQ